MNSIINAQEMTQQRRYAENTFKARLMMLTFLLFKIKMIFFHSNML